MTADRTAVPARMLGVVVAAAGGVTIWRVTALALVYGQTDSTGDSLLIKALLAALGMVFVACGVLVFWRMPSRASLLLAGFCICAGLHWGGPLELPSGQLRTGFLVFYLVVSSLLSEVFFLRFALSFPRESRLASSRSTVWLLYAAPIAAAALGGIYLVAPAESSLQAATQQSFLFLVSVVGTLLAIVAFAFFVSHLFRAGLTGAQKMYVGLMVAGMLTAWVPDLVAGSLGVDTAPWTLTFAALPIAFVIAFLGIEASPEPGASSLAAVG